MSPQELLSRRPLVVAPLSTDYYHALFDAKALERRGLGSFVVEPAVVDKNGGQVVLSQRISEDPSQEVIVYVDVIQSGKTSYSLINAISDQDPERKVYGNRRYLRNQSHPQRPRSVI